MLDKELQGTESIIVETVDHNNHVFYLVWKENQYYLQYEQNTSLINLLVLKPNMDIYFENGNVENGKNFLKPCLPNQSKILATNFDIDPDIFHQLIHCRLISYSKAMADLYSLPVAYSFDIKDHHNDYKRTKNKEKVLAKLRAGQFN